MLRWIAAATAQWSSTVETVSPDPETLVIRQLNNSANKIKKTPSALSRSAAELSSPPASNPDRSATTLFLYQS